MNKHRPALGRHSEIFVALADKFLVSPFQVILCFICPGTTQDQDYEAGLVHGLDNSRHAFLLVILFFQRRVETLRKVPLLGILILKLCGGHWISQNLTVNKMHLNFGLDSSRL